MEKATRINEPIPQDMRPGWQAYIDYDNISCGGDFRRVLLAVVLGRPRGVFHRPFRFENLTNGMAMEKNGLCRSCVFAIPLAVLCFWLTGGAAAYGQDKGNVPQGPPPVPVQVALVVEDTVSEQITLVGTTEAIARSTIASEVSGLVEAFPVREGDFVKKGQLLARLRSTDVRLRLKAAEATREKVLANIVFIDKEFARYSALKEADSIAARKYDEVLYEQKSLTQERLRTEAEIELLRDDIKKKSVLAPFSGFVAKEHTEVGQWLPVGGPVVTLIDLARIRITVDVPERYVIRLAPQSPVRVLVTGYSDEPFHGEVSAILPEGDPNARTFPAHVSLENEDLKIKGGMETRVTFNLGTKKRVLLVPKDAVVTAGADRFVFALASNSAQAVTVKVTGYYDGNVAVEGPLKVGDQVVTRGNERLRPGQPVSIIQ
jgi:RND family efflux transporter MFP subunit